MAFEEEQGQEEQGREERPMPAKSSTIVKAKLLKPKPVEDELAGEVYELKDRMDKLETDHKTPAWRGVGEKPTKPVGTNFDSELLDRMNKTVEDYQKSGVKLYKRKMLEEGLEEQLDVLNSTAEIDDAFEKSCKNLGFGKEAPNIKDFVEHVEGIEDYVWTSERAKYALNLLRGRPEKIEEFLAAEPQVRGLVDYSAIQKAKLSAKAKLPKGAESDSFLSAMLGEDEGEGEGSSESEEEGSSESEDKGDLLDELGIGEDKEDKE